MRKRKACGANGSANDGPRSASAGSETSSAVRTALTRARASRSRPRMTTAASATSTSSAPAARALRVAAAAISAVRSAAAADQSGVGGGEAACGAGGRAAARARSGAHGHVRILPSLTGRAPSLASRLAGLGGMAPVARCTAAWRLARCTSGMAPVARTGPLDRGTCQYLRSALSPSAAGSGTCQVPVLRGRRRLPTCMFRVPELDQAAARPAESPSVRRSSPAPACGRPGRRSRVSRRGRRGCRRARA